MKILLSRDDFTVENYELCLKESELTFCGEENSFNVPYKIIKDFCVTQNNKGKAYFTMNCNREMIEGRIAESAEAEPFITALREKLRGTVNILLHR